MTAERSTTRSRKWRPSVKDWLREGLRIQRRLTSEADRHKKALAGKRRLARVLSKAFRELGLVDK